MKSLTDYINEKENSYEFTEEELNEINEGADENTQYAVCDEYAEPKFCNAELGSKPVNVYQDGMTKEDAMAYAKRLNKMLSPWEKKYRQAHYKCVQQSKLKYGYKYEAPK